MREDYWEFGQRPPWGRPLAKRVPMRGKRRRKNSRAIYKQYEAKKAEEQRRAKERESAKRRGLYDDPIGTLGFSLPALDNTDNRDGGGPAHDDDDGGGEPGSGGGGSGGSGGRGRRKPKGPPKVAREDKQLFADFKLICRELGYADAEYPELSGADFMRFGRSDDMLTHLREVEEGPFRYFLRPGLFFRAFYDPVRKLGGKLIDWERFKQLTNSAIREEVHRREMEAIHLEQEKERKKAEQEAAFDASDSAGGRGGKTEEIVVEAKHVALRARIRNAFNIIDADKSASVDLRELLAAMRNKKKLQEVIDACPKLAPLFRDEATWFKAFMGMQTDQQGEIGFDAFFKFCERALKRAAHVDEAKAAKRAGAKLLTKARKSIAIKRGDKLPAVA